MMTVHNGDFADTCNFIDSVITVADTAGAFRNDQQKEDFTNVLAQASFVFLGIREQIARGSASITIVGDFSLTVLQAYMNNTLVPPWIVTKCCETVDMDPINDAVLTTVEKTAWRKIARMISVP